jgi:TonB family protein
VAPSTPTKPANPSIVRAGQDVPVPRLTYYVEPQYPPAALEAGARGTVKIEITIGREGRVADAHVLESVRGLDEAALAAVRRWEYAPSTIEGVAVAVLHVVNVDFTPPARPSPSAAAAEPSAKSPVRQTPPPQTAQAPPVQQPPRTSARETAPSLPAVTPVKPDPAVERNRILETLKRYEAAWEARDADAVARVHDLSRDDLARIRSSLAGARQYAMEIEVKDIRPDPDGRRAVAMCVVTRRYAPRVGAAMEPRSATNTFTFERRGDAWIITSIQ